MCIFGGDGGWFFWIGLPLLFIYFASRNGQSDKTARLPDSGYAPRRPSTGWTCGNDSCRRENPSGSTFCGRCGHNIHGATGEYFVVLKSGGRNKISVIKEIRTVTGFGLKESKDIVDYPPRKVGGFMSLREAEELCDRLRRAGAEAEVRRN